MQYEEVNIGFLFEEYIKFRSRLNPLRCCSIWNPNYRIIINVIFTPNILNSVCSMTRFFFSFDFFFDIVTNGMTHDLANQLLSLNEKEIPTNVNVY